MKNVFVQMAIMAAAMMEAFRENKMRDSGMSLPKGRSRGRIPGKAKPAGSKIIMRFYKAKHGTKAGSFEEAREWYAGYLAAADAKVREIEATRKAARKPTMKLAA